MLEKSEVSNLLQEFGAMTEKQFGYSVKMVHTENGTEIIMVKSSFLKNGIMHQNSCVDTPQQNVHVGTKHINILNITYACLFKG